VFALTGADISDAIQHVALDPDECYRVLDLNFNKEDLKIYLASGYLIFTKPVSLSSEPGARLGAVFVSSAEGGDADVLLLPPTRSERASLATFTHSPNLEEHFKSAAFVFTDGTGDELLARIKASPEPKKSSEMGGLLAEHWTPVLDNLIGSFETRVVYDVLSRAPDASKHSSGLFYMAVGGSQLENFDLVYDPTVPDQIVAGKLGYENNHTYFNTWTAFPGRAARNGAAPYGAPASLANIRIEATIQPDLTMQAVARATLKVEAGRQLSVIPFNLSPKMRITSAAIDGRAVEVFDRASLRSNLIVGGEDRQFLLISDAALDPAAAHEVEIHSEGGVIQDAGHGVYFVGSRGTWYPRTGGGLANFDLTFRYPKSLRLAASGTTLEDNVDGDWRITHTKTEAPARFVGFNLGNFQSLVREHKGYRIDLYGNYELESALRARAATADAPLPTGLRRGRLITPTPAATQPLVLPPDPAARMEELASNVTDALDFMTEEFGPIPIHHLAVTPIPGGFGQGFPGLVYLSTLAYLDPGELPTRLRERSEQTFYSELLATHEVAHQWWGNLVLPASAHDDWITEALANYSALLLLERKKGIKAVDAVLDSYRNHLLTKTASGRTLESAGPIIWGLRLESSLTPDGWRSVTYEKGTWIMHMLRRQLGDEKFLALLRDIASHHHSLSTDQFRELASGYAPKTPDPELKNFFENWVYGTGLPAVKLSYSWRAPKLSINLVQRDVDDAFSAFLAVEVQTQKNTSVYWLPAGSDPGLVSIPLKSAPLRVSLLTNDCLMTAVK